MSVSRKKNSTEKQPQDVQIAAAINQAVGELYGEHAAEIRAVLEDSEDRKVVVNFGVELDCSESEPMVTTKIRFSTSVTDRRVTKLEDPNQTVFNMVGDKSELPGADKPEEQAELSDEKKGTRKKKVTKEIAE